VLPGADYCYESKSGLSTDNLSRRKAIETLDILQPLPGVPGHARLRVGLDCRSAAIAGKVLSGKHIGNRWWEAVPSWTLEFHYEQAPHAPKAPGYLSACIAGPYTQNKHFGGHLNLSSSP
jgi:hypothetical protein